MLKLQFLGDRVIAVSELAPDRYSFTPYLTEVHPLVRNRNVRGGPLQIRKIGYATGLGMHSESSVTYDLSDSGSTEFRAVVGVDDVTEGQGSVIFAVSVDGRRVYESASLDGGSPAQPVGPIDISGARELTLIVKFGRFANISDVADWCDAVLIKSTD